jgi:hypothetical protein
MADRGMCLANKSAISAQVDELMKFNDDNFESLKRVIARHESGSLRKEAGRIPQVGYRSDAEVSSQATVVEEDEFVQLSSMFGTKKGAF